MQLNWSVKITEPIITSLLRRITSISLEKRDGYFVAKPGEGVRLKPYKKLLFQFDTPHPMREYIGKEYKVIKEFLHPENGELFRVYIDSAIIIEKGPYLTDRHLYLPKAYINRHLDERASLSAASFCQTTASMIEAGIMHITITMEKLPLSQRLFYHGTSLRAKVSDNVLQLIHSCGRQLKDFSYDGVNNNIIVFTTGEDNDR